MTKTAGVTFLPQDRSANKPRPMVVRVKHSSVFTSRGLGAIFITLSRACPLHAFSNDQVAVAPSFTMSHLPHGPSPIVRTTTTHVLKSSDDHIMSASVLGKRTRSSPTDGNAPSYTRPSLPSSSCADTSTTVLTSRKRTRRSAPEIFEDAVETPAPQLVKNTSAGTRPSRNTTIAKDTSVEKQPPQLHDENLPLANVTTPATTRFKDALAQKTPLTPKHRVRSFGRLPTPQSSRTLTPRSQSAYGKGRQLFTQASNGKVIGREAERIRLTSFIDKALQSRTGGCMYVSGPPGTGKSALVQEVMQEYADRPVKTAIVNCVSLKSANDALSRLSEPFCTVKSKAPKAALHRLFTTKKGDSSTYLVLLDEIDTLLSGDCDVLYSIFEWSMHPNSTLILIGIANALDLTDRFLPRLKVRNVKPELLPFMPYSAQQISNIISAKLRTLVDDGATTEEKFVPLMHPAAVQLAGKKIASQTGDLRKAFSLVRRTIDLIEQDTSSKLGEDGITTPTKQPLKEIQNMRAAPAYSVAVKPQHSPLVKLTFESAPRATIAHVAKVAASIFNNTTTSRLIGLNLQQKAVLCSLVASENHQQQKRDPYKTPSKSCSKLPTVKALFEKYAMLCKRDEGLLQPLKNTEFRDVVASLETLGLIQEAQGRTSSLLTPTSTPSRGQKGGMDDKQVASAVSEQEVRESLTGPGADLLLRLFDE
jgi:cell division control protein 6